MLLLSRSIQSIVRPLGTLESLSSQTQLRFGSSHHHDDHSHDHHHLDEGLDENGKPKPYSIAEGREKRGFLWGQYNPHKDIKLSERNYWIGAIVVVGGLTYLMRERPCKDGPQADAKKEIEYRRYLRTQQQTE